MVPIQTRHPVPMAQQALTTQMACGGGRLALGLGPSHDWIVTGQLGLPYDRPARLVRDYLEVLQAAFAGPGPVDVENDAYRVHSPLDVSDVGDAGPLPILGNLILHLVYGAILGISYAEATEDCLDDTDVDRTNEAAAEAGFTLIVRSGDFQATPTPMPLPCDTRVKVSTFCATPSSATSKSAADKSVTG